LIYNCKIIEFFTQIEKMSTEAIAVSGRMERILNLPPKEDRLSQLEQQVKNMCSFFDKEHQEFKSELQELKSVILNRALTPKQAAVILRIKEGAVRKNLDLELLEGYKEGGRWRTTVKFVHDFMLKKPNKYGSDLTLNEIMKFL